ncbi:hypothetical protein V8E51_017901 [Hyaloscypha variabilis]
MLCHTQIRVVYISQNNGQKLDTLLNYTAFTKSLMPENLTPAGADALINLLYETRPSQPQVSLQCPIIHFILPHSRLGVSPLLLKVAPPLSFRKLLLLRLLTPTETQSTNDNLWMPSCPVSARTKKASPGLIPSSQT